MSVKVNYSILIITMLSLLSSCKLLKGDKSEENCLTPEECYDQYLYCPDEELQIDQSTSYSTIGHTASYRAYAQGIQFTEDKKISSIEMSMSTATVPSGDISLEIREDCNGNPCENRYIQISNPVDLRDLYPASSVTEVKFSFDEYVKLEADTPYWIQLTVDLTDQTSKSFYVYYSNATSYPDGSLKYKTSEDGTWFTYASTIDLYFKVYTCE